jgi:8-oxo-dGTP diphosphatase
VRVFNEFQAVERPRVAVSAAIIYEDMLLLVRRANEPYRGLWSLPGGLVELGETLRDAVKREVYEECSIEVEPRDIIAVLQDIVLEGGSKLHHFIIICFRAEAKTSVIRPGDDVLDAKWFKFNELENLQTTPTLKEIRKLLKNV